MTLAAAPIKAVLPGFAEIEAAARRIAGTVVRTPLLESPWLNRKLGGRLLLKAENLQVTGSFKLRGAANRMGAMTEEERARGVVARSSGNHGLAVAYCAEAMKISAVVVAPDTAPAAKIDRIKAYGARLVQAPMGKIAEVAAKITEEEGRIFISPADDPWIVAGQGTVGLELAEQVGALGVKLDALLVCCSGGGLLAGCTLALEKTRPATSIYAVEAVGFDKVRQSMAAGHRINLQPGGQTICDAIAGLYTAEIPYEIFKSRLTGCLSVTDAEAMMAMRVAQAEFGLAIEPGGAVALAAVLSRKISIQDKVMAVTISGRNVDLDLAARALSQRPG